LFYTDTEVKSKQVIEAKAKQEQCLCVKIGKNDVQISETSDNYIAFSYGNAYDGTSRWQLSNPAPYQAFYVAPVLQFCKELDYAILVTREKVGSQIWCE